MKSLLYIIAFIVFNLVFAQEPEAQYHFKILKGIGKEEITAEDTAYKIEIIKTQSNTAESLSYKWHLISNDTVYEWSITDTAGDEDFYDYIRIKITHQTEIMNVTLQYDANIAGGIKINGVLIDNIKVNGAYISQASADTMIFLPGNFCFKSRKNYNYWKEEAKVPKTKRFWFKKYNYSGGRRQECSNDSLRLYIHEINKTKLHCLLIDENGLIRARGKKKWTAQGKFHHSFEGYGIWVFYDYKGKVIARRRIYGKHYK